MASALLTLSEVRTFTGDYLVDAAEHWSGSARRWTDSYDALMRDVVRPARTEWMGEAAEAAAVQVGKDRRRIARAADELSAAATAARRAADDLHVARARLLDTVHAAETAGFTVGRDFSLTSRESTTSPRVLTALEEQARTLGTAIRADVLGLANADERAAAEIARAAIGLRSLTFGDDDRATSERIVVQAVDFHGMPFPEKPPNPPPIPPPEGWSQDPLMRAAQKIAYGHMSDPEEGHMGDFPDMSTARVADLIYQKMRRAVTDPSGLTLGVSKSDGVPVIYDPRDNVLIIRDTRPNATDGGTVFKPGDVTKVPRKFGWYESILTPDQLADGPSRSAPGNMPTGGSGDDGSLDVVGPMQSSFPALGSIRDWGTYVPPNELARQDGALGILGRILLDQLPPNPNDPDSWA